MYPMFKYFRHVREVCLGSVTIGIRAFDLPEQSCRTFQGTGETMPKRPLIAKLFQAARPFAFFVTLMVLRTNTWATSFDFIEVASEVVLARLHTDGTDAFDHSNVTDLTFTAEGDALFGFGIGTYPGVFDSTFAENRWTSDGSGGLTTVDAMVSGILFDDTPPRSTVLVDASTPIFSLRVEPTLSGRLTFVDGTLPDFIEVNGTWRQVPEPSSLLLFTLGLLVLHRYRKGQGQPSISESPAN